MKRKRRQAADLPDASRDRRRWPLRLAVAVGVFVILAGGVYLWASLSTDSSTTARALVWREADIGDQARFPHRPIPAGPRRSRLPSGNDEDLRVAGGRMALDEVLEVTETRAFVVAGDDRIVYERYLDGGGPDVRETSFSIAKSILSALVGIAIDRGLIRSVRDPITKYVPELAERDERFELITLRDLLSMSSGIRYEELGGPLPWGDDTETYYGVDLRTVVLERSEVERVPGDWHYNNYNPLLIGLALERAAGTSVSGFASAELWRPLGAEEDASWNLDSEESGFEKLESGFNATARDYLRFGLLFMHGGQWNGKRVVSRKWVRAATAPRIATDHGKAYGYFWWSDPQRDGRFYGLGNLGQYIYIDPVAEVVIVRLGSDWGYETDRWLEVFRAIVDQLARGDARPPR